MVNTILYIFILVASIINITASIYLIKYQSRILKVQKKLIATFDLMEHAHEVTLEALRSVEDFLKYLSENVQSQQSAQDRLYTKVNRLEEEIVNLKSSMNDSSTTKWTSRYVK